MNKSGLYLISWLILLILAIFIWYRNNLYDRVFAVFLFTLGLYQLLLYGISNQMCRVRGERMLFICSWLQCLVLSIAVLCFLTSSHFKRAGVDHKLLSVCKYMAMIFVILFSIVFVVVLIYSTFYQGGLLKKMVELNHWYILYIIGVIGPILILLAAYGWKSMSLYVILAYIIVSIILSIKNPSSELASYLSVGLAFVCWML